MQLMVDGLYYLKNFTFCTIKLISIMTLIFIPDFAVTVTKPPSKVKKSEIFPNKTLA